MVCSDATAKTASDGQTQDRDWAAETEVCHFHNHFAIQSFIYIHLVLEIYVSHNETEPYNYMGCSILWEGWSILWVRVLDIVGGGAQYCGWGCLTLWVGVLIIVGWGDWYCKWGARYCGWVLLDTVMVSVVDGRPKGQVHILHQSRNFVWDICPIWTPANAAVSSTLIIYCQCGRWGSRLIYQGKENEVASTLFRASLRYCSS